MRDGFFSGTTGFMTKLSCYIDVEDVTPPLENIDGTVTCVLHHVCDTVQPTRSAGLPCVFSLRLCDDTEIQQVNADFRGKDKPTNVLSFEGDEDIPGMEKSEEYLGDVLMSVDTLLREAREQNKAVEQHFMHLLVHSVLHLYGFDHIEDDEAEVMEALEAHILHSLGVQNPYLIQE